MTEMKGLPCVLQVQVSWPCNCEELIILALSFLSQRIYRKKSFNEELTLPWSKFFDNIFKNKSRNYFAN